MLVKYYAFIAYRLGFFTVGRSILAHLRRHYSFYSSLEALYVALLTILFVTTFVVRPYRIPSPSMIDTLMVDDRIFVNRFIYYLRDVRIGDIVVFKVPTNIPNYDHQKPYYIKRVVGLPGDSIEIGNDGYIYRNGEVLREPEIFSTNYYFWQLSLPPYQFIRTKVPEGSVLLFGDNSSDSYDSRYWGPVPIQNIQGKAFFRYWPIWPWRIGPIYDRPPATSPEFVP